ncbi:phage protein Gp27 family protein [Thauera butanivorans]|uniref:phage protein Gp27 family protein n=1 Tax=Thauera butanivorans TaxID=86174 RepID=UPI003AB6652A
MAPRPAIETLPPDLRRALDERLVANSFGDYAGLSRWLTEQGYAISKSALHRYGQALEGEYDEAMADARALLALTRAAGDLGEAGSEIASGAATILQTDLVRTALEIRREADPAKRTALLAKLTRAQADMGRMTVSVERHRAQIEEAARKQLLEEQRAKLDAMGNKGGVTAETAREIRKVLGIE